MSSPTQIPVGRIWGREKEFNMQKRENRRCECTFEDSFNHISTPISINGFVTDFYYGTSKKYQASDCIRSVNPDSFMPNLKIAPCLTKGGR